jgi:hypothetical protein
MMTKTQQGRWSASKTGWAVGVAAIVLIATSAVIGSVVAHPDSQSVSADRVATSPTPTLSPTPVIETKTVTVDEPVPFQATTVNDPAVDAGVSAVTTAGQNGVNTKTYSVTLRDGVEQDRTLVSEGVTTPPVDQVTTVGTKVAPPPPPPPAPKAAPGCDPNYSGACVPIASDVDCAGGSGNGPAYVRGPVQVVGSDIYDLDRNGDGVACE